MQSASDTFSEALIISDWCKHRAKGEKWIGHARLLAEVPSTVICKKFHGFPWVPGSTVFTYPISIAPVVVQTQLKSILQL